MRGADVYPVLRSKGISRLYHANSVVTSNSLLQLSGLASRGCVERHGMSQTEQYTDAGDRHFGVWNDVFTDSVDIHARRSDRNQYGPVLFVLDARLLLELPDGVEILVTRRNPTKWVDGQSNQDRYFLTAAELSKGLIYGEFDQMITFRTTDGILPFGGRLAQIILDDPQVRRADGSDVFTSGQEAIQAMAAARGIVAPVVKRTCNVGCRCVRTYASNGALIRIYF